MLVFCLCIDSTYSLRHMLSKQEVLQVISGHSVPYFKTFLSCHVTFQDLSLASFFDALKKTHSLSPLQVCMNRAVTIL